METKTTTASGVIDHATYNGTRMLHIFVGTANKNVTSHCHRTGSAYSAGVYMIYPSLSLWSSLETNLAHFALVAANNSQQRTPKKGVYSAHR